MKLHEFIIYADPLTKYNQKHLVNIFILNKFHKQLHMKSKTEAARKPTAVTTRRLRPLQESKFWSQSEMLEFTRCVEIIFSNDNVNKSFPMENARQSKLDRDTQKKK